MMGNPLRRLWMIAMMKAIIFIASLFVLFRLMRVAWHGIDIGIHKRGWSDILIWLTLFGADLCCLWWSGAPSMIKNL